MKILITGSTGLLGQALVEQLAPIGEVTGLSRRPPAIRQAGQHRVCDLTVASQVKEALEDAAPDVVVHAQALSDVDACEKEPELARRMNAGATRLLAETLKPSNALLVCVSTDYVFDGKQARPYDERDTPRPVSAYGRSKLESEQAALEYARALIVRPSTLFGAGRVNFCDQIVMRLRAHQAVEAFEDQVTSPTYTEDMAESVREFVLALHDRPVAALVPGRVLHLANKGCASRVEFARRIAELIGGDPGLIRPIPMSAQRRPAPRPAYSALTSVYQEEAIGRTLRSWEEALEAHLREQRWIP